MRSFTLCFLATVGALASATACSDAPTTGAPLAQRTGQAAGSVVVNATLGFAAREIPVGERVMLTGPIVSADRTTSVSTPLTWRVSDPSVLGLSPSQAVAWVGGMLPGSGAVTVTGGSLQAQVAVTVLPTTEAATSVVVDDFYVSEVRGEGGWSYAPQLVLRDGSGKGGSAVIGLSIDLPEAGGRSPRCAMLRPVGTQPMELFHEEYGDFELSYNGASSYRVPAGKPVVAHLTLRVPGPYAKELTLEGRVVPGTWPTKYSGRVVEDVLSCG